MTTPVKDEGMMLDECTQRRGPSGSRKGITKVVLDFVGWVSQGMSVMFYLRGGFIIGWDDCYSDG